MITKIRIKNFKCLRDTGDLEIRPLTFLVGPNSSGKSSLLQLLLILRQTVDSTDKYIALAPNDGWVQMGAYPEFIYKGQYRRNLQVNLEFVQPKRLKIRKRSRVEKQRKLIFEAVFSYDRRTTQINLETTKTVVDNVSLKVFRAGKEKKYSAIVDYFIKRKSKKQVIDKVKPIKFYDFFIRYESLKKMADFIKTFPLYIFAVGRFVEEEFHKLFYLGPLRELPKRIYVTTGQTPQDVGTRGERAVDVLWYSHRGELERIKGLEKEVKNWFKQFAIASDIKLDRISDGNYFRLVITDLATGMETTLADIGFGASQALPIIVESFYAPRGSLILIEQPEIHLHPKAQSILGDLFIKAVKEGDRNFIIETHSEHILARIRRRIAEKRISQEKVAIYYFEPTSKGTRIREVTLNKQGQYESFPDGFFEEDVVEAFEHLKAMRGPSSK